MYVFAFLYYIIDMKAKSKRSAKTIRMTEDAYYQAKVAAVVSRKSLGQWIEEAILEKVERESIDTQPGSKNQLNLDHSVEKYKGRLLEVVAELPTGSP